MKKYLYVDTDLVNSTLAQLTEGIVTNTSFENGLDKQTNSSNTKSSSKGVQDFLKTGFQYITSIEESFGDGYTKSQRDVIEKAVHDYSIDLLEHQLADNNSLIDNLYDAEIGDYILVSGSYKIIDFQGLKDMINVDALSKMLDSDNDPNKTSQLKKRMKFLNSKVNTKKATTKEIDEYNTSLDDYNSLMNIENSKVAFERISQFSGITSSLFNGMVLIRLNNHSMVLCNRESFRDNLAMFNLLPNSDRRIKVLGYVQEELVIKPETDMLTDLELTKNLWHVPNFLTSLVISNFNLGNNGDKIIQPIAIYF
ncbi:DUF6414 family protein [Enterococcus faecalis]|uniref:DUF6414 family protein n=1 Tax=Enterococcus faecalis TaxID=1351 RepID=UPI003D0A244A